MNKKELKRIVDCNAGKMIKKLGLENWQIEFGYEMPDEHKDLRGSCGTDPRSKRAIITLNPQLLTTKKKAMSTLRHELVHILMCPFHRYRRAAYKLFETTSLSTAGQALIILNGVFRSVQEEVIRDICRALEK